MTTICLVNDVAISFADMTSMAKVLQDYCDKVTRAWNQPSVRVSIGAPAAGDWVIHLTEKKRKAGAKGYHTVEGGVPTAYVSFNAVVKKVWGLYFKPLTIKGKVLRQATYSDGIITVICHEVAEMLCDPAITTFSALDTLGRNWLVEVCDHVSGSYLPVTVNGVIAVIPDVTTPAYYDVKGIAPYSLGNAVTKPFTLTPKGYGYYKNSVGQLVKL